MTSSPDKTALDKAAGAEEAGDAVDSELAERTGDVLFGDDFDTARPEHALRTLKRLWRTTKDQHGRLAAVLVSVVFYTALSIAAPWYSAGVVNLLWDNIQASWDLGAAFQITFEQGGREILILLAMYLGSWGFFTLQSFLMVSFTEKLNLRLRTEMSRKLNRLPLSYYDGKRAGGILTHFTNDLDKMSEALQSGILRLFTSVGLVCGSIAMMLTFNVGLTLVFLVFMGLSILVTNAFSKRTLAYASRRQQAVGRVTGLIEENYSGRVVIKAFNRERRSSEEFHRATEDVARAAERADFMINAINPAIRMVNRFGQLVIAVLASKLLIDGTFTVGAFQAFFQYVNQAAEPMTEASYVVNSMQSALASAERVYKVLDEAEMSPEPPARTNANPGRGLVEFKDVRFGYSPDKPLMESVSFTALPGQKVAIVGETGAGKTTLVNLLMRFYDPDGGHILVDGADTGDLPRQEVRENFGMVLQDTWLFDGTIAENIAYGKPDATADEIVEAARAARVDFFVRTMPQGYDTVLGNDAENISVGQRQLLTIARAMLRNPPVLILDEATSSVDTRTEMEINHAMRALMANRTSFVIAHRLSTIVDADLILVMKDGDIVEQGTHESLLAARGPYAELYNSQFS